MQALCKLASLPSRLLSQLLNSDTEARGAPDLLSFRRQESKLQAGLASTLKHSFNMSQLAALAAVLGRPGHISLVQVLPQRSAVSFACWVCCWTFERALFMPGSFVVGAQLCRSGGREDGTGAANHRPRLAQLHASLAGASAWAMCASSRTPTHRN